MGVEPWSPRRASVDRNDGLPKYAAIARAIAAAVTAGELAAGEMLPSQRELAEGFGVTVMTVRQAVQVLMEQGLLMSEQGKGTYVRSGRFRLRLGRLASLAAQVEASGRSLTTEVLGFGAIELSPIEQRRMGLGSAEAFELIRLRFVDDTPVILQTSVIPPALAGAIEGRGRGEWSLYDVLEEAYGVRVERAEETVSATALDRRTAQLLGRAPGEPALLSSRLTYSSEGAAVVDDRALTAGDSVVLSTELHANREGPSLMLSTDVAAMEDNGLPFLRGDHR